jgi:DNA-binding NtrC family response regulator
MSDSVMEQPAIEHVARPADEGILEAAVVGAARAGGHVLVVGDAGDSAGQRIVARLIHRHSRRAAAQMITVMCAGLPDTLLESELFGHLRGSFSGAYRDKPGLLELAANGTLFLGDVGEMSARLQAMLLQFLETGAVRPIGADDPHGRVDVRIIAGADRGLRARVESGAFSRALFSRLSEVSLVLQPLRDRREDIPFLLNSLLRRETSAPDPGARRVAPAAMRQLAAYDWPGNVRELENVVDRLGLDPRGPVIKPADLPAEITGLPARRAARRARQFGQHASGLGAT